MLTACFGVVEASGIVGGVLIIDASTRSSRPLGGEGEVAAMVLSCFVLSSCWSFAWKPQPQVGPHFVASQAFLMSKRKVAWTNRSCDICPPKTACALSRSVQLSICLEEHVSLSQQHRCPDCTEEGVSQSKGGSCSHAAASQTRQHTNNDAAVSRQETSTLIGGAFLCQPPPSFPCPRHEGKYATDGIVRGNLPCAESVSGVCNFE